MGSARSKLGFTVVELLAVTAIIGLLVVTLLPAIQAAREAARQTSCKNQFRQLGLAVLNYESAHDALPLAFTPNWADTSPDSITYARGKGLAGSCPGRVIAGNPDNGKAKHNWVSFVLPFFEQSEIYDQIDFKENWSDRDSGNFAAAVTPLAGLICPAAPSLEERRGRLVQKATGVDFGVAATDYTVCIDIFSDADGRGFCELVEAGLVSPRDLQWLEGMMQDHQPSLRKVTDGLSQTLMLFECAGRPLQFFRGSLVQRPVNSGNWANPNSYMVFANSFSCKESDLMNCSNWDEIYSFHPGGANFLFGDGAVKFQTEDLDLDVFVSQFTRAGGDILDESL